MSPKILQLLRVEKKIRTIKSRREATKLEIESTAKTVPYSVLSMLISIYMQYNIYHSERDQ